MCTVIPWQKSNARTGVTGCATQVKIIDRCGMPRALNQATVSYHLIRVQQAMCPVTVGHALHAGEMIRGKNSPVHDQVSEVRHVYGNVIYNFLRHLVAQFSPSTFFCLAGEVKAIGGGDMVSLGR